MDGIAGIDSGDLVSRQDDFVSVGIYCIETKWRGIAPVLINITRYIRVRQFKVARDSISVDEHDTSGQDSLHKASARSKKERWTSVIQPGELMQLILEGKMDGNRGGG